MMRFTAPLALLLTLATAVPAQAAVETYTIDPLHTFPSLEFSHMGLSIWRGKFNRSSGRVTLDREARKGSVDITIETDSIDFGLDAMHEHAVKEEWFDVAKYPKATYKGDLVYTGDQPTAVDGQLTIKGITKPVKLKLNSFKCMVHPYYRKFWCGGDATGELLWSDFGMKKWGEGDADKVRLLIQVEAGRDDDKTPTR